MEENLIVLWEVCLSVLKENMWVGGWGVGGKRVIETQTKSYNDAMFIKRQNNVYCIPI